MCVCVSEWVYMCMCASMYVCVCVCVYIYIYIYIIIQHTNNSNNQAILIKDITKHLLILLLGVPPVASSLLWADVFVHSVSVAERQFLPEILPSSTHNVQQMVTQFKPSQQHSQKYKQS